MWLSIQTLPYYTSCRLNFLGLCFHPSALPFVAAGIIYLCLCEQHYAYRLHTCAPRAGRNVQWNQEWELPPPKDDEEAIKLLQYSNEELLAMLGDPLNEIGAGGFSSVYRGQIPIGGVAVAVKCPREDKSGVGVLESLS